MLLKAVSQITPAHDSKLRMLLDTITEKIEHPINPGNKKVIIFTAFSDTAQYLYDHVSAFAGEKYGLNTALVTGSVEGRTTIPKFKADLNNVLTCFSPRSKDKAALMPDGPDIDLLIATDCISEGQNLQDCDCLINYDIHWNPVRLVQRFGRIDRIGSKNDVIQLINFWPDMDLDSYINLKGRVETRMKALVMTSTGDDNLLSPEEQGNLEYRREQLKRLQTEVVDLEEMGTGVSITDLGLNEFRMEVMEYAKRHPELELMPLTKDKYFELIDSNSDYPHFRCALGAYIPGSLYKYFSIPDDSDEARKRFEQLKSGEIWFSKRSGLNDPFEFEHIALKGAQNDARQYYLNKQQELEVCCFSALLYNKLMWSHYAAGYKGYCVEFRVESPERFYPVIYENEVPDLSQEYQRFYDMRNEMCANPSLVLNNYENRKVLLRINYPLFSKDTCWSYEEEYRILDSSTVSNGELQQMTTNGLRVTKIIAGAFCTDLNFQRLKEVAGALNVPLSKIGWDSNLRLNEVPLP